MNNYHYYNIYIGIITSNVLKKERHDILNYFENNNEIELIKIILSIRILDEGINLVKCDSVYLTYFGEEMNDIRTTQRFLRANRKDITNPNKKANIFIWCEDTNICLNAFQMLKNNDINFNKKIIVRDNNYETYYIDEQNKKLTNINKYDINNECIKEINIKCLTDDEIWELKKNILFEYCNIKKNIPLDNIIYKNYKIGSWYNSQKIKILNNDNKIIFEKLIENIYVKEDLYKLNKKLFNIEVKKNFIEYKCYSCNYNTHFYKDLKKHLNRKNSCIKKNNSTCFIHSSDKLLILSMLPYQDNKHIISLDELDYLNDSNIVSNNKKELFDIIDNIEKHSIKKCNYCAKNFEKVYLLKYHILHNCFHNYLLNKNKLEKENNNDFNSTDENITDCDSYSQLSESNETDIEIKDEKLIPIPFEQNWDLSSIPDDKKSTLVISSYMYSKLLEEVLKNKINLNVILNKKNKFGMVYKNDTEKYTEMKSQDIIDNTMEKLNKCLLELNKTVENVIPDIITISEEIIEKKYVDYQKDEKIHGGVSHVIKSIFDNNKDNAIDIAKNIVTIDKIPSGY
jgi:hypothetical protein